MGSVIEQFGGDKKYFKFSRQALRWAKRAYSKWFRQQWKKHGEDAIVQKRYKGWLG